MAETRAHSKSCRKASGSSLLYVFSPHAPGSREYVAIESGTLLLTIDRTPYHLHTGDSIYYAGDCVHAFVNPGKKPCVYYLAMDVKGDPALARHRPWKPESAKKSAEKRSS